MGRSCLFPLRGQTSSMTDVSHILPPRATYCKFLVRRMSSSSKSTPGGYMMKSASLPRDSEPREENIPKVVAAEEVAARRTWKNTKED